MFSPLGTIPTAKQDINLFREENGELWLRSFLYVFYAKIDKDGNHFFETVPLNSTARTPEDCFPPTIPNDFKLIIDTINAYENGED